MTTREITDKTLMPISLIITICGAVYWLSAMNTRVEAASKQIDKLEHIADEIQEMKADLKIIRAELGQMRRRPIDQNTKIGGF
jgi:uncharacterized protein Yka (UPF0111/DUF47 family)